MKKILLIMLSLLLLIGEGVKSQGQAGVFHLLFICAPNRTGNSDLQKSLEEDWRVSKKVFNDLSRNMGYRFSSQVIQDMGQSDELENFTPSSNDIVVLIYCGHGKRSERGPVPDLLLYGVDDPLKTFESEWFLKKFLGKNYKHLLMLVDACNSKSNYAPIIIKSEGGYVEKPISLKYKIDPEIFFSGEREMILLSSKEGEQSYADITNGSLYLQNLLQLLSLKMQIQESIKLSDVHISASSKVLGETNNQQHARRLTNEEISLYRKKKVPARDTDGDGVKDEDDNCPTEVGKVSNCGCPETKDCKGSPRVNQLHPAIEELLKNMVYVEGGSFTLGCTSEQGGDCASDESPAHQVTLSSYQIGKYEVTQAQWEAVMGSNPSRSSKNCPNCPVESVSWNEVQEFIIKLNAMTGKRLRLPTEAEWEYAAHGGNKSRGYKYSGGNNLMDVGWYKDNSGSKTHPVGQKRPNELGIYDMSGNVWEWCQDWIGPYSSGSERDPLGPSSGDYRVDRGGGWDSEARYLRVNNRFNFLPGFRDFFLGFRLVLPSGL